MHDDHNIPYDDDEDDGDVQDDESTSKWKLNPSERAQHSSLPNARRKDLFIPFHFLLKEFSMAKGKTRTGTKQMDADDSFFLIKNMEASESALLNSGKGHVDPEIFKRWRMKKC